MENKKIIPGELHFANDEIIINENSNSISILMENTGDRPIQIGSHFHLYEANSAINFFDVDERLDIDRNVAWGKRFDIPSGTSIRFEPNEKKKVQIIDIAGEHKVYGVNNLCDGSLSGGPKTPYSKLTTKDSLK